MGECLLRRHRAFRYKSSLRCGLFATIPFASKPNKVDTHMSREFNPRPNPLNPPAFQPHSGGPRATSVYPSDRGSYLEWCLQHRAEGRGISTVDPNSFWDNVRELELWKNVRTFANTHR